MIVRSLHPVTETVATIMIDDGCVSVSFPERRDDFYKIIKQEMHFFWNGSRWIRKIGRLNGIVQDRAADVGHRLLGAGFIVAFPDKSTKIAAVEGTFAPECRRWVLTGSGKFDDWFRLRWFRPHDDWRRATSITGSRYDANTKSVCVPLEHFAEVEDFAEMNCYRWTPEARALLRDAKRRRSEMEIAVPTGTPQLQSACPASLALVDVDRFYDCRYLREFTLATELMQHQRVPIEKLSMLTIGGLFMDMGLGKTRVAIELAHLRQHRISRVVWFCPVSLKATIAYEIGKHTDCTDDDIIVENGEGMADVPQGATWYIIGIESMSSSDRVTLVAGGLIDEYTFVIVDESSYIKGHNSRRTRRITALSELARYRLILTGTPLSQGVVDLYAQMRFLSPGVLGYRSFYSFSANHLEYHPDYPDMVVRSLRTDYLAKKIAPFVYQVTKDETGIKLPMKRYDSRYFPMTNEQSELYYRAKMEILDSAEELDSHTIFRLFTALQQIASGYWNQHDKDGNTTLFEVDHERINLLLDIVHGLPDEKIIIWCKYLYSAKAIAVALTEEYGPDSTAQFHGDIAEKERAGEINRFRNDAHFLVATMATGGHGLTLNESNYTIFYENGFKYSERIQAEDRNHRIGQTEPVTYIDLVCQCGIDKRIQAAIAKKANVVQEFRQQMKQTKDEKKCNNL